MQYASLDGVIGPAEKARIPVTDDGLLRGDGVFEVARLYSGQPFALEQHLARLQRSADNLRLSVDVEAVRSDAAELLKVVERVDGVLRIVLTRGGCRLLLTEPLPQLPDSIRLGYVTYSPTRVLDGIKSLSYAANMLASRIARERGFDEALLITPHEHVLEAPTASLFWVSDGKLLTPPLDEHILSSITRAMVLELFDVNEQACKPQDLAAADEAFLVSSIREVMPVAAVEDHELEVNGPVTLEATARLRDHIAAQLAA